MFACQTRSGDLPNGLKLPQNPVVQKAHLKIAILRQSWGTPGFAELTWDARYNGLCLNLQTSTLVKAVRP